MGPDFYEKHRLFDEQAAQLQIVIDELAERIRTLGYPISHLNINHTALGSQDSGALIVSLLRAHEYLIVSLRDKINLITNDYEDFGSGDLLTSTIQIHEKMAWILRASQIINREKKCN